MRMILWKKVKTDESKILIVVYYEDRDKLFVLHETHIGFRVQFRNIWGLLLFG